MTRRADPASTRLASADRRQHRKIQRGNAVHDLIPIDVLRVRQDDDRQPIVDEPPNWERNPGIEPP